MLQRFDDALLTSAPTTASAMTEITDYAVLFEKHRVAYKKVGYHLQAGEIGLAQGWILHISVVRSQLADLLDLVIPFLAKENVPFKIVQDKETARNILDGNMGDHLIGKIVTIYPEDVTYASGLAKRLIRLTAAFKGPAILTDIHLGSVIYTRYGGFNPVLRSDASGNAIKYIYDTAGELVEDAYAIPFVLPKDIQWPFIELASPVVVLPSRVLRQIYRPLNNLKTDPRGNVIKAIYLHHHFFVRKCVIKQGIKNMWSDDHGRDIPDRLNWQKKLHDQLKGSVALPAVLDLFTEQGNTYMVMEFCKGESLRDKVAALNANSTHWSILPVARKILVLDYLLKIIDTVQRIHEKGYVHRDITPVNFLVNKKDQLIPIDLELAYSVKDQEPAQPFVLGTSGFMSPEQEDIQTPTFKEDIYGIGATMITLLTGFSPIVFYTGDMDQLEESLLFFTGEASIASIIAQCLHHDAYIRPELSVIQAAIQEYKSTLNKTMVAGEVSPMLRKPDIDLLSPIVSKAVHGLSLPPVSISDHLWASLASHDEEPGKQKREYTIAVGLHHGQAGVLYLLNRARKAGYDITSSENAYGYAWDYIDRLYLRSLPHIVPGLYGGAAGIALAMAGGIEAGLIADHSTQRDYIRQCLQLPHAGFDLADGVAGQLLSILQCSAYLEPDILNGLIQQRVETIKNAWDKKGYWIWTKDKLGRPENATSLHYGNAGITWALLEYASQYDDAGVIEMIKGSLSSLYNTVKPLQKGIQNNGFRKVLENKLTWDGLLGTILVHIKAYEYLKDPVYKQRAKELLAYYPFYLTTDNFYQDKGLAGLGELYLEAYRVLGEQEWMDRADWIAAVFMHACRRERGACFWLSDNALSVTADLLAGNGGIIHFLMRYLHPEKMNYRLLLN